jgi:hypothetical protein
VQICDRPSNSTLSQYPVLVVLNGDYWLCEAHEKEIYPPCQAWIGANCESHYLLGVAGGMFAVYFDSEADAMLFNLRFSHPQTFVA